VGFRVLNSFQVLPVALAKIRPTDQIGPTLESPQQALLAPPAIDFGVISR
jgi:hypothetical protein